jgi:hypothetical protein
LTALLRDFTVQQTEREAKIIVGSKSPDRHYGFSTDKKIFGWKVWQKKDKRIGTAIVYITLLHNLFRIGYS